MRSISRLIRSRAEGRDETWQVHRMTSLAWKRSMGGIVRPSA